MTTAVPPAPQSRRRAHRTGRALVALLAVLALATGCDSAGGTTKAGDTPKTVKSSAPPPPKVTMNPADGASGVAPASPVSVELESGELAAVTVRSEKGDDVAGAIAPGTQKWTSKGKLAFGSAYTVQVTTAQDSTPRAVGSFTTAATPPASGSVRASSVLGDGKVYGVGMPIILKLSNGLASQEQRAAFERTLSVKSTPATSGAWGWINNREVHFRPTTFWAAGATVHVAVDSAGQELGDGKWGRADLTVDFKIGMKRELHASAKTHYMQVLENGKLVKNIPVSLGSPKRPSSQGTFAVIDKRPKAMFDSSTYGLPVNDPDGYRTEVNLPMRLTWGGEFLHSAPWSVNQQGRVNVSHGCINLSPANAAWVYNRIQVGDPVTVQSTGSPVKWGDGWMDWSLDFAGWLRHSATGEHPTA